MKQMTDFRNREVRTASINFEQHQAKINKLFELVITLSGRLLKFENNIEQLIGKTGLIADRAEYRSLALMQVLEAGMPNLQARVLERAEQLLKETFEKQVAEEDALKGLAPEEEGIAAAEGHFAVFGIKLYYKKEELVNQSVPRGRVEIGKAELFPELDQHLRGMKVGETKMFPLSLQGQTDEAELTLLSLKKKKPKEELNDTTNP